MVCYCRARTKACTPCSLPEPVLETLVLLWFLFRFYDHAAKTSIFNLHYLPVYLSVIPQWDSNSFLCRFVVPPANKPCTASSSIGDLVLLGSSFQVFCTYQASCRASTSMHIDKKKIHKILRYNSTTIFLNVTNISKNTTYTCLCEGEPEPCGLDIDTGCKYGKVYSAI